MKLEREGIFHAHITGWKPTRNKAGWMGIMLDCICFEEYDSVEKAWNKLEVPCETTGIITLIGEDGSRNDRGKEEFEYASGWDGTLKQLAASDPMWEPRQVEVSVRQSKKLYNGEYPFQVSKFTRVADPGEKILLVLPSALQEFEAMWAASEGVKPKPKEWKNDQPTTPPTGEVPF